MRERPLKLIICAVFLTVIFAVAGLKPAGAENISIAEAEYRFNYDNNFINAQVAANYLNGAVVLPGEVFSYNDRVGPRTLERGFVYGDSVGWSGRDYVFFSDVGGGVCRTSTMLNKAVVQAGLIPVERTDHGLPVTYASRGMEAAVQYGQLDYKFCNTLSTPVVIRSFTSGDRLVVTLEKVVKTEQIQKLQLFINSKKLSSQGYYIDGAVMLPCREVLENLGYKVEWFNEDRMITAIRNEKAVALYPNKMVLYQNGVEASTFNIARMIDGKVYLPQELLKTVFKPQAKYSLDSSILVICTDSVFSKKALTETKKTAVSGL